MDPIQALSDAAGFGLQLYGMSKAHGAAAAINQSQQQILGQENYENSLRRQAMNMSAQRQQIQTLRNTQRARAMGIAASVNQGAQLGSGRAGGEGGAAAAGAFGELGILNNQQIGNQIFNTDSTIDALKGQLGNQQTSLFNAQGMMSLGGSLVNNSQTLGKLGQAGFGSLNSMFAPNLGFS